MDWQGFGFFLGMLVLYLILCAIDDHWPLWGRKKSTDVDKLVKQISETLEGEDPGGPPVYTRVGP